MALIESESYRKGVIKSTFYNIIAKGIGFVNSLLIIYIFGSGFGTDLYFIILATVTLLTSFVNGIDLLILIPEAMNLRLNKGEQAEKAFLNFFIILYLVIGLVISILILLSPVLFYSHFSKYTYTELGQENLMLTLSAILFPIQLLNSLFVSILSSHRYFTVPMMANLVNSLVSITVLVLLGNVFSITSAVLAITGGYFVNFVWLLFFMKKRLNWVFFTKPIFPTKKILGNIFLMQINLFPISLRGYIITLLLSGFGVGVITALNYGQQISFIPEMLILAQVIAVAGIKFNELSARGSHEELNILFSNLLSLLFFIIMPIGGILAIMSDEVVKEIFGRSNKINKETLDNIAMIIFFIALTIPARSLDMVMTKLITAQQKIKAGVIYGIVTHSLMTLLIFIGIKLYGLKGYLGAFFIGNVILLPLSYFFLIKKITPFIGFTKWLIHSIPFILFNILLIFGFMQIKEYFLTEINPLFSISLIATAYFSAIIIFNYISGYYEPVNSIIRKRILRK